MVGPEGRQRTTTIRAAARPVSEMDRLKTNWARSSRRCRTGSTFTARSSGFMDNRAKMAITAGENIDWATAESLAFGLAGG
jgi:2-oxoglutarate dehydrogenase complex dehydrogenase (E1) component-like enzyme